MLTKKVKNVSWRDWTLSGPWLLGLEREEEMMIDARFDLLYLCIPIGYSCGPAEYWSPLIWRGGGIWGAREAEGGWGGPGQSAGGWRGGRGRC